MTSYCQDLFKWGSTQNLSVKLFSARTATRVAYFFGTSRPKKRAFPLDAPVRGRAYFVTFLVGCALTCASCTRQVQTSSVPAPVPAVHAVMVRQAQNAAEAGDGDLELRRLRQFLAANPNNPDARILMARYYEARGLPDL